MSEIYDQTLALAGIFQSLKLVQNIAKTGEIDDDDTRCLLESILNTDPQESIDVYGSEKQLMLGFRLLQKELTEPEYANGEMARYLVNVFALSQKLMADKQVLSTLSQRIDSVKRQQDFSDQHDCLDSQTLNSLASIYVDLISPLSTKIQVIGTPEFLQQPLVQSKIRALLLAAVRSAVLWRQVGGKKRHLMFNRKQIIEQATLIVQHKS